MKTETKEEEKKNGIDTKSARVSIAIKKADCIDNAMKLLCEG